VTRLALRERLAERPPRTVATVTVREDGSIEIDGEPTSVDFLGSFRVLDRASDRWVSKEENPELWLELIGEHVRTPFRWLEQV
jgi:hypothetical protein